MKAVRIHRFGGPDVIALEDIPTPQPAHGEILIRVRAASVNPIDYKIRGGGYLGPDRLPLVLGGDVAGVVEACGGTTGTFKKGDEAYALLESDHGGYAELTVVKAADAAMKPARLDFIGAAAVPLAALTAWQGLFDHGQLHAGQTVLIHGGAGGVGHFAVQFAKTKGARVITTVAGRDMDFARELGADVVIDYQKQRFEDEVRDIDMVFDLVAGETQERSWAVLRPGGVMVSTLGQPPQDKADRHKVRAVGYQVQPSGAQLTEIASLIDHGPVTAVVDQTFPLAEARQAQERQEQGHVRGKIVLKVAA